MGVGVIFGIVSVKAWALLNFGGGVCGRCPKYVRGVFIAVYHEEGFGVIAEVIWGGGALGPVKV